MGATNLDLSAIRSDATSYASSFRTLVGLGIGVNVQAYDANTVKTNVKNAFSKQQNFTSLALTSSAASIAWNLDDGQAAKHVMTENTTLANPTNMVDGGTYILKVTQHASLPKTLGFGNAYKWAGGVAPAISTTIGAVDIFTFISDGTFMYGSIAKGFA